MRSLRRSVARNRMKKAGIVKACKNKGTRSYFSKHWREYS